MRVSVSKSPIEAEEPKMILAKRGRNRKAERAGYPAQPIAAALLAEAEVWDAVLKGDPKTGRPLTPKNIVSHHRTSICHLKKFESEISNGPTTKKSDRLSPAKVAPEQADDCRQHCPVLEMLPNRLFHPASPKKSADHPGLSTRQARLIYTLRSRARREGTTRPARHDHDSRGRINSRRDHASLQAVHPGFGAVP